ncbi:MAG: ABC transporter permease [Deltaproteobacteria bacterium]|nr:ABC transporter permease [Deltaproteobacteria bacterium]
MSITRLIGRRTIRSFDHVTTLLTFASTLLLMLFRRPREGRTLVRRVALEQIYFTAVQALSIIIPVALIIGSAIIIQFSKLSAQYDLGSIAVILIVRELGPAITALLIILRSATAVTIETGYMQVLHEIDALEMLGIDVVWFVCIPRLIGITMAILCLFVVFDIVAIIGGYGVVWTITHLPVADFLRQIAGAITVSGIAVGLFKAVCFGITITATSTYHGLNVRKHITEVPVAASRAAVECFFFCLVLNVLISALFYL